MVFCNMIPIQLKKIYLYCHNPYFNRWFSAILKQAPINELYKGHNPYFNRWFSAMSFPYGTKKRNEVTILILIDGFLQ